MSEPKEHVTLEIALRQMWEKVRTAGETLSKLQGENKDLTERNSEIDRQLAALRIDLAGKEQELKRLKAEHTQLLSTNGKGSLSDLEKENLKSKIRELIAKINSHI